MKVATTAYLICAILSIACAALLLRAWSHDRRHLLLWSGVCFAWLAVSNVLLFVDLAVLGDSADLRWARSATFFAGLVALLCDLIWRGPTEGGPR